MGIRKQTPTSVENWLYQDLTSRDRVFSQLVYLGINAEPWPECTNEEKLAWEAEHPEPEPEEPAVPAPSLI